MGTKNNPGAFDCYVSADPDEPMFTLLARDRYAPALVESWAARREAAGEDPSKVREARECAFAMRNWRKKLIEDTGVPVGELPYGSTFETMEGERGIRIMPTTRSEPPHEAGIAFFSDGRPTCLPYEQRVRPLTMPQII